MADQTGSHDEEVGVLLRGEGHAGRQHGVRAVEVGVVQPDQRAPLGRREERARVRPSRRAVHVARRS